MILDKGRAESAYHLHLNYNRWKKAAPKINIGDYLKKFGGGGHERAGGASVKSQEKAASEIAEIIDYVLKNG
ncbi:MAG: DHHA1 domain-containing protein [Patescibacteria group bacterium]|nr:DHHA1 domain-containing protein [Patescibacteria group bacterium]